ncbi:MAG: signal peptidase I [Chlamydiales bacterium]
MPKLYSLRKSRKILRSSFAQFRRRQKRLSTHQREEIERELRGLDEALLENDREKASKYARNVVSVSKEHMRKSVVDFVCELFYALLFALVVAFIIRQFWFELYQVPTGSMRPTIEELDRLVVSKTTFGTHLPLQNKLFFHKPDYIRRNGIIVFTTQNMDIADNRMLYFGIFPGKKRFIKRCVSKPGDTLYFYGGRIYGIDQHGYPFDDLSNPEILKKIGIDRIEHIPYISFEGKVSLKDKMAQGVYGQATFKQMNLPLARLTVGQNGLVRGTFFNGEEWAEENLAAMKKPHTKPEGYSELWGMGNYAMCRLLTQAETRKFYQKDLDGKLILELRHTPNLTSPRPAVEKSETGRYYPALSTMSTLIPLDEEHLITLRKALITARFQVRDGQAFRYHESSVRIQRPEYDIKFPKVPNGTYEFYYGKGSRVLPGGILWPMSAHNSLYNSEFIQKLFNQGFAFNLLFNPTAENQPFNPQRFAYWRDGDLYVMGAPLLKKGDPLLTAFIKNELERQESSSYIAFIDHGPPVNADGTLDIPFIQRFGLSLPDNAIIALGDNYAGSADSRDFGFVPVENLRGAPSFIFWPPGPRLGPLPQPTYPWLTLPNLLTWSIALVVFFCSWYFIDRRNKRSIFK